MWSDVSRLAFRKVSSKQRADIEILFAHKDHGDGQAFDGPDGTLAHAFYPFYGGDIHLDANELWGTTQNGCKCTVYLV